MSAAYAIVIERDGLRAPMLFAYGPTRDAALLAFRQQIVGGTRRQQRPMIERARVVALSPEEASEVAECITADALCWAS